ncbi:MAG: UDP-N-acetylglucosamine--N-acetylmuramyl-(pentapeptide) pyrophosphoryl-undecaprenol N-acetylglucosamine transferase, partial [Sulfurihydrogenibium sp.]
MKTVFISGGGTGGHYYPALAVAEALKEKGYKVVYIGTTVGIEAKKGFPAADNTYLFEMKAVRGKSFLGKIEGILSLIKTTFKVIKLIKKENPSFSICFGGYTSFPLGVASFLTRKDLYIHEQNSIPSYTNRVLSIFAKKVFITFDYSKKFFNTKKTYHVGLPLRKSIIERAKTYTYKPKERKTVLIFGGSQGSKKLSEIAIEIAKSMPDKDFILIKGKWDLNVPNLPNLTVYDYYDKMEELYEVADVVVSRSGSGTVNEVLAFGKYAIFIPYPYAASNHQYYNVKWLYDLGLCDILEE